MKIIWPDGRVEEVKEKNDKELAVQYLQGLTRMRDGYSDEIPGEIIHSASQNNKYKCRVTWFCCLWLKLENLEKRGLLLDDFVKKYQKFMENYVKHLRQNDGLTAVEDIWGANHLINDAIACLEARLNSN